MKTLETIIERELKAHIDDIPVCTDIIAAGSENPKLYDGIISLASKFAEDIIKLNFEFILSLAYHEYDFDETEPEEEQENIDIDPNISSEDEEMLNFISA